MLQSAQSSTSILFYNTTLQYKIQEITISVLPRVAKSTTTFLYYNVLHNVQEATPVRLCTTLKFSRTVRAVWSQILDLFQSTSTSTTADYDNKTHSPVWVLLVNVSELSSRFFKQFFLGFKLLEYVSQAVCPSVSWNYRNGQIQLWKQKRVMKQCKFILSSSFLKASS